MDGVKLTFEPAALRAIAHKAIERKCGARGLRAIIEEIMLDTMFMLPDRKEIAECVIDLNAVNGNEPKMIEGERKLPEEPAPAKKKRTTRKASSQQSDEYSE